MKTMIDFFHGQLCKIQYDIIKAAALLV